GANRRIVRSRRPGVARARMVRILPLQPAGSTEARGQFRSDRGVAVDVDNGVEAKLQPGFWRRGSTGLAHAASPARARTEGCIDPALAARWDQLAIEVGA